MGVQGSWGIGPSPCKRLEKEDYSGGNRINGCRPFWVCRQSVFSSPKSHRLYDPVEKKLVRSHDIVYFENQTIEDVDKARKPESHDNKSLVDFEPVFDKDVHDEQEVPSQVPIDPPRRSNRERRPSTHYSSNEYVLLTDGGEPESYEEAVESEQKRQCLEAMQDEMNFLYANNTFELVRAPKNKEALKNRWVYRLKHEDFTSVPRFKAKMVKGFSQKLSIFFLDNVLGH
nr:Retrovirus-related Pol polyprotein from transposon TNT 1-94 [Ipomoea batatas]